MSDDDDDDSSNKGNTGHGRNRRSIKANLLALVNSVAVITALMSTCHFIFVPSMQQQEPFQKKENPIQKLLKRTRGPNKNNVTTSVATIVEEKAKPTFDFGDDDRIDDDDDDDYDFQEIGSNETKSFWGSLRERTLGRTKISGEIPNNDMPTGSLRKSAKAPP